MSLFDNHGYFLFPEDGRIERTPEEERNWEKGNEDKALALMNAHWEYHDILQNNKELYVSRGSKIGCTLGSKMVALDLMQDYGVTIGNEPALTCKDCGEDVIHNFGYCKAKEAYVMAKGLPLLASGRGNNRNSIPEAEKGNAYPHICIPVVSKNWTQTGIDSLLIETGFEEESAALREHAILVCQYGGIIGIYEVKEVVEEPQREEVKLSPWLIGYKGEPTRENGRRVKDLKDAERKALGESNKREFGVANIDWYAYMKGVSSYISDQYTAANRPLPAKDIAPNSKYILINEKSRYWVGVGPVVLVPDYNTRYPGEKGTLNHTHFKLGTEIDVVLQNKNGDTVYIECIFGMIKAHTYQNGIFQTGIPYPHSSNANEDGSKHKDGSYIEFLRADNKSDEDNGSMSDYSVKDIIVYPREW